MADERKNEHIKQEEGRCADCGAKNSEHREGCCGEHEHHEHADGHCPECEARARGAQLEAKIVEHDADCCCSCCSQAGISADKPKRWYSSEWFVLGVSLLSLALGFLLDHLEIAFFKYVNPSWVAVILCGVPIFIKAYKALRKKKIVAAMLISIAIIASLFLEYYLMLSGSSVAPGIVGHSHSYVFAAGEVAFLMRLGELIEAWTVKKSRLGVNRLVGLVPKKAIVKTDVGLMSVPIEDVKLGDIVVCRAGETISVDGEVVSGATTIDQSSMTGEAMPAERAVGDNVFCGTINLTAPIEIRVTKLYNETTINHMVQLVKDAEQKKAPIARIADKWVTYIVPGALGLALVVFLLALIAFGRDANTALVNGVTVLVVFCPCSLALATPTAIAAAIGRAAMLGAFVKSGECLERLSKVDTVCLDKTGTLTSGEVRIEKVLPIGISKDDLIIYLASCERYSDHPLAKAIVKYSDESKLYIPENAQTLQGIGMSAVCNGREVFICSYSHALQNKLNMFRLAEKAEEYVKEGMTVVVGYIDGQPRGIIGFSDSLRENAKDVVRAIDKAGYHTVLLTGDNEYTARRTATDCWINEYRFQQMPEDKLNSINELRTSGKLVCMVGDGINDAPALASADVGIAMSSLGSDIAVQTADIAVMNNDLSTVEEVLKLSKKTMRTIVRNIVIAMGINFIAVVLTTLNWLSPALGAIIHNCTSLIVVGNSALILLGKGKRKEKVKK